MKVLRKQKVSINSVNNFKIGDQLMIPLNNLGTFTATAQKVTDDAVLFLFDKCVDKYPMNQYNTNIGGFDESDLKLHIEDFILPAFPKYLRCRITDITLPSYGEIFGHDEYYENFEPDENEQLELMKQRENRIGYFEDRLCWYWLRNATKKDISASCFALVGYFGGAYYNGASDSGGVRMEFWLKK